MYIPIPTWQALFSLSHTNKHYGEYECELFGIIVRPSALTNSILLLCKSSKNHLVTSCYTHVKRFTDTSGFERSFLGLKMYPSLFVLLLMIMHWIVSACDCIRRDFFVDCCYVLKMHFYRSHCVVPLALAVDLILNTRADRSQLKWTANSFTCYASHHQSYLRAHFRLIIETTSSISPLTERLVINYTPILGTSPVLISETRSLYI